jgi:hypothetical protein
MRLIDAVDGEAVEAAVAFMKDVLDDCAGALSCIWRWRGACATCREVTLA